MTKLLNFDQNAKTIKGQKKDVMTAILYLAPAKLSGFEVCPKRSKGCTAACLNTAGRGVYQRVQDARIRKTKWYFEDRQGFMTKLVKELKAFEVYAKNLGFTPVVRLNGTSDIPWERISVTASAARYANARPSMEWHGYPTWSPMQAFPDLQFYDYTKITKRAIAWAKGEMPPNYHLTFSLSEDNDEDAIRVLMAGGNVAVVFADKTLPDRFGLPHIDPMDFPVIDGDADDMRFADGTKPQGYTRVGNYLRTAGAKGTIIGLKAKGKARKDTSGFVRRAR